MKTKIMLAAALVAGRGPRRDGPSGGRAGGQGSRHGPRRDGAALRPCPRRRPSGTAVAPTQADEGRAQDKAKEQRKGQGRREGQEGKGGRREDDRHHAQGRRGPCPSRSSSPRATRSRRSCIDKPLTITKAEGRPRPRPDGRRPGAQVLEGEPLRLEIKGGEVKILKEGKGLADRRRPHLKIAKETGEEARPSCITAKATRRSSRAGRPYAKEGEAGRPGRSKRAGRARPSVTSASGEPEKGVQVVEVVKDGNRPRKTCRASQTESGWTIKEGDKEAVWFAGKPGEMSKASAFSVGLGTRRCSRRSGPSRSRSRPSRPRRWTSRRSRSR
ncbi:MAG: hypothetical protein M0C28_40360 [Candidatus Moduliflexus flocculans]|nr:hypothetical protein [Candidatus Moduliflexus flocculans]